MSKTNTAAKLIDKKIEQLNDWRGETLANVRKAILSADSNIIEEWKWNGPVWSCGGIICTGEVYKSVVKITFANGASLKDKSKLFNSSLEGKVRRAIDLREREKIKIAPFRTLIKEAVAYNLNKWR